MIPASPQEATQLTRGYRQFLASATLSSGSGSIDLRKWLPLALTATGMAQQVPGTCLLSLQSSVAFNFDFSAAIDPVANPGVQVAASAEEVATLPTGAFEIFWSASGSGTLNVFVMTI